MLPQPDPVTVQAGAVGAPSNALMDANQAAHQAPQPPPAQATLPMPPQAPTFAPALGQQIDVWMKGGVQHAEVQLSPQDLGPIRVKIEMQGDQTRVHMSADVQSTRDALQQAMPQLSEQLGQVGLSLTGGGVSDQPAFQQAQAQAQARDGGFGGNGRPRRQRRLAGGRPAAASRTSPRPPPPARWPSAAACSTPTPDAPRLLDSSDSPAGRPGRARFASRAFPTPRSAPGSPTVGAGGFSAAFRAIRMGAGSQ